VLVEPSSTNTERSGSSLPATTIALHEGRPQELSPVSRAPTDLLSAPSKSLDHPGIVDSLTCAPEPPAPSIRIFGKLGTRALLEVFH
jgi:hypothetical protein